MQLGKKHGAGLKMKKTDEKNSELLSLTLKTPDSAADAAAVASMLHALVVLVEETRDELKIDGEFSIRVNPFNEGSLEIPIQVFVFGAASALFTFNPGLLKLLDTLKSFFELKKYFKGETPSDKALQNGVSVGNITMSRANCGRQPSSRVAERCQRWEYHDQRGKQCDQYHPAKTSRRGIRSSR